MTDDSERPIYDSVVMQLYHFTDALDDRIRKKSPLTNIAWAHFYYEISLDAVTVADNIMNCICESND